MSCMDLDGSMPTLLERGNFLDALPTPCLYLGRDRRIIYANTLSHTIIRPSSSSQQQLAGFLLHETDFARVQLGSVQELESALEQLENPVPRSVRLTAKQSIQSIATTSKHWSWTVSSTTVGNEYLLCLTAHETDHTIANIGATAFSKEQKWQMLQNIARPSYQDVDHTASISLYDTSKNLVNARGHADHGVESKFFEAGDQQLVETLWTADFTRPATFTETAAFMSLEAGKSELGMVRGIQDSATGLRSVIDLSVTVLAEPFSDNILGCVTHVRPAQEWSDYILLHDVMEKLTTASGDGQYAPMVRTMLSDGSTDYLSPAWQQYSARSLSDLCAGAWEDSVHPEDLATLQQCTASSFKTGSRQECEVRYRAGTSGSYRYFTDTIAPWKDANKVTTRWYCISTDTHELVSQRKAAKFATQRLYDIVQAMDLTVYEIDSDYVFSAFQGSLVVRSLEGDDRKVTEYIGTTWDDGMKLVHVDDRAAYRKAIQDLLDGSKQKTILDYRVGPKRLKSYFVPIRDDLGSSIGNDAGESAVTGVLGLCVDLTAQYEIKQAQVQIEAMKQASRLKDEFVANISHELRTPIAGILGLLDLMIETELTSSQLDMTNSLQSSANGLLRIVNDLLDYSKVEANAMPIERRPFELSEILDEARRSYQALAIGKSLQLDIQPMNQACPTLLGDALRIRQVLNNLLSNAIKFTVTGFVRLTTTVQVEDSNVKIEMVVSDSGIGISEEVLARLFKPFVQADQSTTRMFGGSGLGLFIARRLAQAMNGDVILTSNNGQGTTSNFSLTLDVYNEALHAISDYAPNNGKRLSADDTATPSSKKGRVTVDNTATFSQCSILIVEDNMVNQKVIVGRLRNFGVTQISCATHGGEAIAYMKAVQQGSAGPMEATANGSSNLRMPNLIFMDCQMPVLDGFETTRQLRSDFDYRGPIIALTASAVKGYRQECLDAGMNDFLTKPFTKDELSAVLRSWLPKVPMPELTRSISIEMG